MTSYTALIPTMRVTGTTAILAASFQTVPPERIIVLDTGPRPRTADYEFRMALDIVVQRGQDLTYVRSHVKGVRAARLGLGPLVRTPLMLWIDDDSIPEPNVAEALQAYLTEHPKEVAAVAQSPTPNNEWEDAEWCPPEDAPPPYRYASPDTPPERSSAGMNCAMIRTSEWGRMKAALEKPWTKAWGEDQAIWEAIGNPMILPAATAWEMKHPGNRVFAPYPEAR